MFWRLDFSCISVCSSFPSLSCLSALPFNVDLDRDGGCGCLVPNLCSIQNDSLHPTQAQDVATVWHRVRSSVNFYPKLPRARSGEVLVPTAVVGLLLNRFEEHKTICSWQRYGIIRIR